MSESKKTWAITAHRVTMKKPNMKLKRTPTPWKVEGREIVIDGESVAEVNNPANAAFIVRAVNSHDELIEAVKDYLADLKDHLGAWTIERLEQAIAKAEDIV